MVISACVYSNKLVYHLSQGGNKTPENFFKAMGGVWRMITSDIGCVRVDFAQPFSLQVNFIVFD